MNQAQFVKEGDGNLFVSAYCSLACPIRKNVCVLHHALLIAIEGVFNWATLLSPYQSRSALTTFVTEQTDFRDALGLDDLR